jgi:hypothetical protein
MKTGFKNIFLILILLACVSGWAQEDPIMISSSVDKARIRIGDLITYTVTVTHAKDIQVEMPGLGANLGGFEIRDYQVHDPKKEKDRIVSQVDYTISTFFTGEFEIPPLTVFYLTPADSTAKILATEKIKIVVESVKASEASDIRDIKPPVEIPRNWWITLRWFVLGAGVAGLAVLAYWIYRRRKEGKGLLPVREVPPRPPHEVALERIDRLRNSDLLEKGEIKQYYIEVSEIIRQYIEGRYFIIAMEMTTTEVLEGLAGAELPEEDFQYFSDFLNRCDLVKFAKVIPSEDQNHEILETACEIVHRTKVVIEEPVEEAGETQRENQDGVLETVGATEKTEDRKSVETPPEGKEK